MNRKTSKEDLPKRRSVRLPDHNYSWTASYFVTIRAAHHQPVFEMSELRTMLQETWTALPERFPCVSLDEFIIMPDHVHGILRFNVTDNKAPSLGQVMGAYKSITTVTWFNYLKTHTISWSGLLWQGNYHEHVIRDVQDLEEKRRYIRENPQRWAKNPNRYT